MDYISESAREVRSAGSSFLIPQVVQSVQGVCRMALRNGLSLQLVSPASGRRRLALPETGSVLCLVLAGAIGEATTPTSHSAGYLHLLRGAREPDVPYVLTLSGMALAVLIHFPTDWCRHCTRGPGCKVGRFLHAAGEAAERPVSLALDAEALTQAERLLRLRPDRDVDILLAEQAALALLAWTYDRAGPSAGDGLPPLPSRIAAKLDDAVGILHRRLDDPPTIPALARLVGMNECDLKRYFKYRHGKSIAVFSREARLETACRLLRCCAASVAEIGLEIGFSNPSQFARAFRKHYGKNPAEYRRDLY